MPTRHHPPCQTGRHDRCQRATPLRATETSICRKDFTVTNLPAPYTHPSDVSATGPRHTSTAQVWLADRVCRWQCPCTCHAQAATSRGDQEQRPVAPAADQLDLLDLIGADQ